MEPSYEYYVTGIGKRRTKYTKNAYSLWHGSSWELLLHIASGEGKLIQYPNRLTLFFKVLSSSGSTAKKTGMHLTLCFLGYVNMEKLLVLLIG